MSEYRLLDNNIVQHVVTGTSFPSDPSNNEYLKYLIWVEEGGTPLPRVDPIVSWQVPTSASKLGLKRAFSEMGQWATIKAMIASNDELQEEWDLAVEIRRADPLVQGMIPALGLSEAQVDALLIRAAELVA